MTKSRIGKILFVLLATLLPIVGMAQSQDKIYMHKGNKDFVQKKFADAEVNYRKSLELNPQNIRARYNLGNALLYQQKPKDAMKEYEKAAPLEKNPRVKAAIYHNMGVILQSQKQFAQAIACYKESLRNNPQDDETRYNLALCQYQLKNNKNNNQNKQKQKQKQQDKKKDQNKDQDKKKEQQKQQQKQQQKNQMSKENADQLLKAAQMKEDKTQQKVRRAMQHPNRHQLDQNW